MKTLRIILTVVLASIAVHETKAQRSYTLEQLTDKAMSQNRLLAIKQWQIEEKQAKVKEDEIRRLPVVNLNGSYQYNFNLADLTIPAGTIGVIPTSPTSQVLLPEADRTFTIGSHNFYNAGVSVYQPVSQQARIRTGIELSKVETAIAGKEREKAVLQIRQGVEQLYYAALITGKQQEEAKARLDLAKKRLGDLENALEAGKTLDLNKAGLLAAMADEEQQILKLEFQIRNYKSDLAKLAGLSSDDFELEASEQPVLPELPLLPGNAEANPDIQIAALMRDKASLGLKATQLADRPDFGLMAGYVYQSGNPISPAHNPFVGFNLKWNIQDLYANRQTQKQRSLQVKQAEESLEYTRQQLGYDLEKAYRKASQSRTLIAVAEKALNYRRQELKLQEDRVLAGMGLQTDLLTSRVQVAKAEADLYGARLSYIISLADLRALTGDAAR